ncbi:hypothetical protein M513_12963 [Trichuris suis]|uniref:Reverse transcriptase domain-containing protein n=1 Tax=Trichuris suis TaxID=68888 RepID=A0A085LMF9_9BILA|nr:hypothetical protein M513_12963 [Trichuris suis]
MDTVCRGLDFAFVYVDDILIASRNHREHLHHLRMLFQRLHDHDLIINPARCKFSLTSIDLLGHRIDPHGAVLLPDKVDAIRKFAKPTTVRALQEFLGMVTFTSVSCFLLQNHAASIQSIGGQSKRVGLERNYCSRFCEYQGSAGESHAKNSRKLRIFDWLVSKVPEKKRD